jgi:peroxiredoxin/DNA-binding beta-propeller fold protein YncE
MNRITTSLLTLACFVLFLCAPAQGQDAAMDHAGATFRPPADLQSAASELFRSNSGSTIIVRYLGYRCSHCVRQLLYINSYAEKLRHLGVRVLAISEDTESQWKQLVTQHNVDTSIFEYVSDPDGAVARRLGAQRIERDTLFDLHATIVRVGSSVKYATFSSEPDMDVARIIGALDHSEAMPVAAAPEFIDRYLQREPVATIVAGPQDGIVEPLDLDFNRSYLHPNDLWVVTTDKRGHAIAIIHEATSSNPVIVNKKDSRASHFMWRTMSISMGSNGAFATAQNGEPGDGELDYMFMGPTLWSSDTSVFASRYQNDPDYLASHLDMLHQSPYNLGIAHDSANVYWVSDAKYKGISRYDFRDPHEVGGTDHRDGVIRRYVETSIVPAERGRPAHVALDKSTGYLYYVDPGKGAVHCLDTRTGRVKDTLIMPPSSAENLEEFTSVIDAAQWTVVSSLSRPIGIEVIGKRLLVGDEQTSRIYVYVLDGKMAIPLGYIQTTASSLHGIVVGPDGKIWYTDKKSGTICRLDLGSENSLVPNRRAVVRGLRDTVSFTYNSNSTKTYQPAFQHRTWDARTGKWSVWSDQFLGPKIPASSSSQIVVDITSPDTTSWYVVELAEIDANGNHTLRAQTTIVPERTRRVVVQDERYGTFNINDAVLQTSRKGYTMLPSDVFLEIAHELPFLKTLLWNSGTAGEISVVDDAVLRSCIERNVDVMLIADDPLLLRTDLAQSVQFFREFGVSMRGAQQEQDDKGQRRYTGVLGDPVTSGMATVECALPRLAHHRGGQYMPSVLLRPVSGGKAMLSQSGDSSVVGARYERGTFRSIILGINASRFLDGGQRTIILGKGLAWLEESADSDPIDTTTSVRYEGPRPINSDIILAVRTSDRTVVWNAQNMRAEYMSVDVYASTGQKIAELYNGSDPYPSGEYMMQNVSSGCYHVIVRTATAVHHRAIILR